MGKKKSIHKNTTDMVFETDKGEKLIKVYEHIPRVIIKSMLFF